MNFLIASFLCLSTLCALTQAGVNPNARTSAGTQSFTGSKTSNGGYSIDVSQAGGRKTENFNANAGSDSMVSASSGHKAGIFGDSTLKAGKNHENVVEKIGDAWQVNSAKGNAHVKANSPNSAVVGADDEEIDAAVKGTDSRYLASAVDGGEKYHVVMSNKNEATVHRKGQKVATVTGLQDKTNVEVQQGSFKGKASSIPVGSGKIENKFSESLFKQHSATLHEDATFAEIKSGAAKTSVDLNEDTKQVVLSGHFITGAKAVAQYSDAKEEDCPYNAYSDRRAPGDANKPWKYSDPAFKIYWDEMTVSGEVDQSSQSIKAKWPQCLTVNVPVSFPTGTKLEKLAVGMAIYFPGCPRFTCAGRVCGVELLAQNGAAVGEACFTDDICKLKPVPFHSKKHDFAGYGLGNAESNLCSQGYNGGTKLMVKSTFCQHEDDRNKNYRACPLLNIATDEGALDKKIVVITRLYEKKPCKGLSCLLNQAVCSIKNYYLHGCRETGIDYKITAFGLNADDVKFTGIRRGQTPNRRGSVTNAPTTRKPNVWGSFWNRG